MSTNPLSYQSANAFPAKLLRYANNLSRGLYPIHLQLIITNKCNLKCPYCSCGECDRSQEMEMDFFVETMDKFVSRGLQSVTITGGGEPLMHPRFGDMVDYFQAKAVCIGMSTNGALSRKWPVDTFHKFEWIRVSFDNHRESLPDLYWSELGPKYSFSYVYSDGSEKSTNFQTLMSMARNNVIGHLRIVSDISGKGDLRGLEIFGTIPDNVILQDRSTPEIGAANCWIPLVKPVLNVDGLIYTCCCAQYALDDGHRLYPEKLCMGTPDEYFKDYIDTQRSFAGSICKSCYYGQYNRVLDCIKNMDSLDHSEFI